MVKNGENMVEKLIMVKKSESETLYSLLSKSFYKPPILRIWSLSRLKFTRYINTRIYFGRLNEVGASRRDLK